MDFAITNSIVNLATSMTNQKTSVDISVAMLKKTMALQASSAQALLEALELPLATTGTMGTQVNVFA